MKTVDEILAENTKLTADIAAAQKTIADLQAKCAMFEPGYVNAVEKLTADIATVRAELATARTEFATVTKDRDTLKGENANLQASIKDFEFRVAAEVAKKGIKFTESNRETKTGTPMTATEILLAARGVESVEELATAKKRNL
jgi:hypothetical protein